MSSTSHEARMGLALADLAKQDKPNFMGTAKKHGVSDTTLSRRFRGIQLSRHAASSEYRQNLTLVQEETLITQINCLTDRGIPPTSRMVRNFAEEMIGRPVGKNWTGDFVKRYKGRLTSLYLRNIDNQRMKAEYAPMFKQFYDLLIAGIEKYNITAENIYNWDEKGFVIGQASATKRIMTTEALDSGRIAYACQDGNREFISLLACISATGAVLPPSLIYKGDSKTLQTTWVEDWVPEALAHFTVSSNGWSCDALGLHWLEAVFQRYTSHIAGRSRRLLIVDGHSSHVNLRFITLCDSMRILPLILPPHSTHRLQPLGVSLFAPLARYYTNGLNTLVFNSLGMVSMSKRAFWSVFWPAWQEAFSEKNVASGFRKTGIWPYDPSIILSKITKPPPKEATINSKGLKTPLTCRAVRRIQRQYRDAPCSPLLVKLFRANELLASQHSVDQHVITGLTITLKNEKKKRNRGQRLNLLGEDDIGPQFFSPRRVQTAQQFQAQKEADEAQRQQDIIDRRAAAATKKAQKEADKIQKAILTLRRRQIAAEAKAQKAIDRQALAELKKTVVTPGKGQTNPKRQSLPFGKAPKTVRKQLNVSDNIVAEMHAKEVVSATSRGRKICRPQRFDI